MYRIIDGPGTGKTSRLLLLAKENNGVVVCVNPSRTREKAYAYGLTGINFMSYTEYIANSGQINVPVYIDDMDSFMCCLTRNNLSGYTLSED